MFFMHGLNIQYIKKCSFLSKRFLRVGVSLMQYAKYTFYALLDSICCPGNYLTSAPPLQLKAFCHSRSEPCGLISDCADVLSGVRPRWRCGSNCCKCWAAGVEEASAICSPTSRSFPFTNLRSSTLPPNHNTPRQLRVLEDSVHKPAQLLRAIIHLRSDMLRL